MLLYPSPTSIRHFFRGKSRAAEGSRISSVADLKGPLSLDPLVPAIDPRGPAAPWLVSLRVPSPPDPPTGAREYREWNRFAAPGHRRRLPARSGSPGPAPADHAA